MRVQQINPTFFHKILKNNNKSDEQVIDFNSRIVETTSLPCLAP